ncbi:MAG: dihydropteroate synthase [Deltaproteobacteria bacterium]|jgi:dihydropteroate synthase|nr:dihydropteroate synthase [Deltaproteobacteria bacterium]
MKSLVHAEHEALHSKMTSLSIRGTHFVWGERPYVMGIVNVTPDSFSDGGRFFHVDDAVAHAERLIEEGADILDVGGESSRPFSAPVSTEEELRRTVPVIQAIRERSGIPISVDTTKAEVAQACLDAGADMINDISALRMDSRMADVVREHGVPCVLMHMKGVPKDMQVNPFYADVEAEVRHFLEERIAFARNAGIPSEKIIIDPGIGFGKRFQDNLVLLNRIDRLRALGYPVLVGPSRKAFLAAVTGIARPDARDTATIGAVAVAALRGADMVRVHSVQDIRMVLRVMTAIIKETME